MKKRSDVSSVRNSTLQVAKCRLCVFLFAVCCVLPAGTGCESLQRKFTRKPKNPAPPPTPIVQFVDYSKGLTPLDRYRKHYLLFDYWNDTLLSELQSKSPNAKRLRRASVDALAELRALQDFLDEGTRERMNPLIEERSKIEEQLERMQPNPSMLSTWYRRLEFQKRQIGRDFFWRDVENHMRSDK